MVKSSYKTLKDKIWDTITDAETQSGKQAAKVLSVAENYVVDNYQTKGPRTLNLLTQKKIKSSLDKVLTGTTKSYDDMMLGVGEFIKDGYGIEFTKAELKMIGRLKSKAIDQLTFNNNKLKADIKKAIIQNISKKTPTSEVIQALENAYPEYKQHVKTLVNTSLQNTYRESKWQKEKDLFDYFVYVGPKDSKNREYCYNHARNVYPKEEAQVIQDTITGFYNCRHSMEPALMEELASQGVNPNDDKMPITTRIRDLTKKGYSRKEIIEMTGANPGTVGVQMAKARKELKGLGTAIPKKPTPYVVKTKPDQVITTKQASRGKIPTTSSGAIKPSTTVPKGDRINSHLRTKDLDAPSLKEINTSLDSISDVHGVSPSLSTISIKNKTFKNKYTDGKFTSDAGTSFKIEINPKARGKAFTSLHEIGHHLDLSEIGPKGSFATNGLDDSMRKVLRSIEDSASTKSLRAALDTKAGTNPINGGSFWTSKEHLNYLLTNKEQFARAYAQYISEKSGSTLLLDQLEARLGSQIPTQWATKDFKVIREAFDDLFEDAGLLIKSKPVTTKGKYIPVRSTLKESTVFIDSLTDLQRNTLTEYTSVKGYKTLNTKLHAGTVLPDNLKTLAKDLDDILRLSSAPRVDGTVYRGLNFTSAGRYDTLKKSLGDPGMLFKDPAFMSTTTDLTNVEKFSTGRNKVVFTIKSKSGVAIEAASKSIQEKEVLFRRNVEFRVIGVTEEVTEKTVGGQQITLRKLNVQLEEIT